MNVLIVEDERGLADAMKTALEREGYSVVTKADGEDGENEALTNAYDIIILDVMLPTKDGFEILANIKNEIDAPIIMATAKGELEDKLNGLVGGADDYIPKPFHIKELIARVNIVLRRNKKLTRVDMPSFGDLSLDTRNSIVSRKDKNLSVTGKEFRLLEYLILQKGKTSAELFNKVCNVLSEYSLPMDYIPGTQEFFLEHMETILKDHALSRLREL